MNDVGIGHIPLFIEPVSFDKISGYDIGNNPDKWDEKILEYVYEDIPYISNVPFELKVKKKDRNLGYLQGMITFKKLSEGNSVSIPVIVQKRELYPLDVIIHNNETLPLNEDNFLEIIQKARNIGELGKYKKDGAVERYISGMGDSASFNPPTFGKYASVVLKSDKAMLLETVKNNESYKAGFIKNATVDCLSRALKTESVDALPESSDFVKVSGKVIKDVEFDFEPLTKTGSALVIDRRAGPKTGLYIDEVRTLNNEKIAQSLFIGENTWAFQEKIAGKSHDSVSFKIDSDFEVGDDICFVKKGECAYEPLQILSKITDVNGTTKIAARNSFGQSFPVVITEKIANICKSDAYGYLVPSDFSIIKLGKKIHPMDDFESLIKVAMSKIPGELTYIRNVGRTYNIENEKIGEFYGLFETEAIEKLSEYYDNASELISESSKRGHIVVSSIKETEKTASISPTISNKIRLPWTERVKLASALSDPESVDAVLNLGFVNKENIKDYVSEIPNIERIVQKLCSLLIAIRTGVKGDEPATRKAIEYLQQVLDSLKALN